MHLLGHGTVSGGERLFPSAFTQTIEFPIKNVSGQDDVDSDLSEPLLFCVRREESGSEVSEFGRFENVPRDIKRILLG